MEKEIRVGSQVLSDNFNSIYVEMPMTVNTYDIDIAGHVNNIVHIRWLEDMRNALCSHIYDLRKLLDINYYLVVTSSEAKYKKPILLFDKPLGKMFLHSYSHGLIVLKAEISVEGQTAFVATQKCVLMNLSDNKMFYGNIQNLTTKFKN